MNKCLVDINVICCNHENYIARCLDSVLNQKSEFSFRIIVADDFSSDNTRQILLKYAQTYDKIELVFNSERKGVDAFDRPGIMALKMSSSKYIALLDGDDYWTDEYKLQKQVSFLESNEEYTMCFHQVDILYTDGGTKKFTQVGESKNFRLTDFFKLNPVSTSSMVFRNIIDQAILEKISKCKAPDWFLGIILCEKGKVFYFNNTMSVYRRHSGGIWSTSDDFGMIVKEVNAILNLNSILENKYSDALLFAVEERLSRLMQIHKDDINRANRKSIIYNIKRLFTKAIYLK